ncbi:MAG: gamma-glutamylcyclotransferase family protein [Devosia sp.]
MVPSSSLLFVYGTLRDPDLLAGVLARPLNARAMLAASAPGLRAVHYPGRAYPALVRAPGDAAIGLVLTDLTAFERDLLDAFEGEEYHRRPIPVMIGEELHEADAYLPAIAIGAGAEAWTLESWQAAHKPRVLKGERATADELRRRLIAVRPN